MPDEEKTVLEEAGHTESNGDNDMHIDSSVLNNPLWIDVAEASKLLKRGDRQTRNIAEKYKWEKRYAKIKGLPRLHYPRSTVQAYIKENGPIETMAAKPAAPESSQEMGLQTTGDPGPGQQMAIQLASFIEVHKTVVSQNEILQKRNTQIEKETTFWKTSLFWLLIVTVLGIGGVGTSWFFSHKELISKLSDLSTRLTSKDNELLSTKTNLIQSQTELKTLKETFKVPETNSTGGEDAQNRQ
jgi:hypothetical protein